MSIPRTAKEFNIALGARLRSLRAKEGRTQMEMGKAIGIDQGGYCLIERGTRALSASQLFALSGRFGWSPDDVLRDLFSNPPGACL